MKTLLRFRTSLVCMLAACPALPAWAQHAAAPSPPPSAIPMAEIGARATADYRGEAIGIRATAGGAKLHTGFQKLEAEATPEGLWLSSTEEGGGRLRLRADRLGRQGELPGRFVALPTTGAVSLVGKMVTFTRPGLTEEYSVSIDGVRQDFVIAERPAGAGGLRVELSLGGARAEAEAYGVKITLEGSGRELAYSRLLVTDAKGRELPATLVTNRTDGITVCVEDAGAVYPVRIDPTFSDADWVSLAPATVVPGADDTVRALALQGTEIYVGGDFDFIGNVAARNIAKWNGSAWSPLGTAAQNGCADTVNAISVVSATEIYVGGLFATVADSTGASISANRIAKWNGSAWSPLGTAVQNGCGNRVNVITAVSATEIYVGGAFTNVADSTSAGISANFVAKWNGSAWSPLGTPAQNGGNSGSVNAIAAVSATEIYIGGSFTTVADSTGVGISANRIAKWNSVTNSWSPLGSAAQNGVNSSVLCIGALSSSEVYLGGAFTTASDAVTAGLSARRVAKWNGSTWSPLGTAAQNGMTVNTVFALAAVSATEIYMGGNFGAVADSTGSSISARGIAQWNSVTNTWSPLGTAAQNGVVIGASLGGSVASVNAILPVSSSELFVGGDFLLAADATNAILSAGRIARWNRTTSTWSQIPAAAGGVNSNVFAVAVSGSDLFVGGSFTAIGAVAANRVARWNGSTWSPLGTPAQNGCGSTVNALAVLSATEIYVGGTFTTVADSTAASLSANRIAKWNSGTGQWSRLGTATQNGCGNTVNSIAVQSPTDVYIGGSFNTVADSTAASITARSIAKWNGSAWSPLGTAAHNGCNGVVNVVAAVSATEIYVGGFFTGVADSTSSGIGANRVAKWNGSAWSPLGTATQNGCGSTVNAIAAASPTDVYVGGIFTTVADSTAASITVNRIAKWNGSTWSRLGSVTQNGVSTGSSSVSAIVALSVSEIYVGGNFGAVADANTAGLLANRIARWDGTDWTAIGGGVSGTVRALAVDGSQNVIVGGDFLTAGSSPRVLSPFLVVLQDLVPEIAVEQPAGTNRNVGAILSFSPTIVGSSPAPLTFKIRNTGGNPLTLTTPVVTGGHAGDFIVNNSGTLLSIPAGQETTFAVTFTPTAGGNRTTTLRIPNNDADENPFDLTLNGTAYAFTTDTDLDGLNDATEFQLAALGFDPAVNQAGLVNTLFGNLGGAQSNLNAVGYFTTGQVQALHVDTPLIQRDGLGQFKLTIGVQKSTTLAPLSFTSFSMTAPQTTINGVGKLEFQFTSPDNAAFFRLQAN